MRILPLELSTLNAIGAKALEAALSSRQATSLSGDELSLARLRLALQLPRFSELELQNDDTLRAEAERVLRRIRLDQERFMAQVPLASDRTTLHDLELRTVSPDIARILHERFHYIGSYHEGIHLGLWPRDEASTDPFPWSLFTFSAFDLDSVRPYLPSGVPDERVVVLSRAYSFRAAPPNAFSYGVARALRRLQGGPRGTQLVLSYVNPNVGFTSASYRASNWRLLLEGQEPSYYYLDGTYITIRELRRRFGSGDFQHLRDILGARISRSKLSLLPLKLYIHTVP